MSKTFNTLQELWQYCLFCPLCREPSRTIDVSVGPDDELQLTEFQKEGNCLKLFCFWFHSPGTKRNKDYNATFIIDCDKNTFELELTGKNTLYGTKEWIEIAKRSSFYLYLHSSCYRCRSTYADTGDIDLFHLNSTVSNFRTERETIYLVSEKAQYHLTLDYDKNLIRIGHFILTPDNVYVADEKFIDFPLIELNFSDQNKLLNKIKTWILLS